MTTESVAILQVAVAVPLRREFDYLWSEPLASGTRVLVSFGRRKLVGVVTGCGPQSGEHKLKRIERVLDASPVLPTKLFQVVQWAAGYYHHSIGEALHTALPVLLRHGGDVPAPKGDQYFHALPQDDEYVRHQLKRAPVQFDLYRFLQQSDWSSFDIIREHFKGARAALTSLTEKQLVEARTSFTPLTEQKPDHSIVLTEEQQLAADKVAENLGQFRSLLLQGITGSGKTEVYLEVARKCIAKGQQVLFLVPEISLTPQLVARVSAQLGGKVSPLHSGMTDRARYQTWWLAKEGIASAVLGTRSAVFTPFANLGLIVVDEEHDISYKQQDGFRYHARDLAIKRASVENVPIILGSATPSLESLHNGLKGTHQQLRLDNRVGSARLPSIHTVDLTKYLPVNGLTQPVMEAIGHKLDQGEQVIIYINRRGYAPLVQCYGCNWQALCRHCDAKLTFHQQRKQFRCHHCGNVERSNDNCPDCDTPLFFAGAGTQRIEQALLGKFPHARICRLDRDEANTSSKLYARLEAIRNNEVDIIVGTQLITKGHDFSNVSLVCIINADQGLFSIDFRAPEFMFQQLLQVSGRAGRAAANGEVLVQTAYPENIYIKLLQQHNYVDFANGNLLEREQAGYPPFAYFALFRAESVKQTAALEFLRDAENIGRALINDLPPCDVQILRAVTSPMEKLANRFRAQLLVRCSQRKPLHQLIDQWLPMLEQHQTSRTVRWSLDIDPMDMA